MNGSLALIGFLLPALNVEAGNTLNQDSAERIRKTGSMKHAKQRRKINEPELAQALRTEW